MCAPGITLEMALALAALVDAGLMIRSFLNLAHTPIGVETDRRRPLISWARLTLDRHMDVP